MGLIRELSGREQQQQERSFFFPHSFQRPPHLHPPHQAHLRQHQTAAEPSDDKLLTRRNSTTRKKRRDQLFPISVDGRHQPARLGFVLRACVRLPEALPSRREALVFLIDGRSRCNFNGARRRSFFKPDGTTVKSERIFFCLHPDALWLVGLATDQPYGFAE